MRYFNGYQGPDDAMGEFPFFRPPWRPPLPGGMFRSLARWVAPNQQFPAPGGRRVYLRCTRWLGPAGMVPGPGMPIAQPGLLPPGYPALPGAPGVPGLPAPGMGGRRRRRRR